MVVSCLIIINMQVVFLEILACFLEINWGLLGILFGLESVGKAFQCCVVVLGIFDVKKTLQTPLNPLNFLSSLIAGFPATNSTLIHTWYGEKRWKENQFSSELHFEKKIKKELEFFQLKGLLLLFTDLFTSKLSVCDVILLRMTWFWEC